MRIGSYSEVIMRTSPEQIPPKPIEKWWKQKQENGNTDYQPCIEDVQEGYTCPSCLLGELRYNGLFQLICDNCGRVAEAAVFT